MEEWGAKVLGPAFNANIISHRLYFPTQLLVPLLRSNSNNQLTGLDGLDGTLRFALAFPHSSTFPFISSNPNTIKSLFVSEDYHEKLRTILQIRHFLLEFGLSVSR
jgi:hypothetical protein